jgi:hypothetical protein
MYRTGPTQLVQPGASWRIVAPGAKPPQSHEPLSCRCTHLPGVTAPPGASWSAWSAGDTAGDNEAVHSLSTGRAVERPGALEPRSAAHPPAAVWQNYAMIHTLSGRGSLQRLFLINPCLLRGVCIRKNVRIHLFQRSLGGKFPFYRHLSRKKVRLNRCCTKPLRGSFFPIPSPSFLGFHSMVPLPDGVSAALLASLMVRSNS